MLSSEVQVAMIELKKQAHLECPLASINTADKNNSNKFVIDKVNGQMTIKTDSTIEQTRQFDTFTELNDVSHPVATPKSIVRYCVASLGLTCAMVSCYAQMVFCIAIVEMVLPSHEDYNNHSNNSLNSSEYLQQITCPIDSNYKSFYDQWRFDNNNSKISINNHHDNTTETRQQLKSMFEQQDKFNWDASQQGILLGAFAIGAAPLQVFGGRMAEIYGAKWVLFAAGFGTAITNFLIPHIAHYSYYLLIVVRIFMGISQSGMESALMCLFAEWLAPAETSFFISLLLFAICIGGFLGSLCSAYLLTLGLGWHITYYVASGLSFVWSILWLIFATSRPQDHKLLSKQELNYILNKQRRQPRNNYDNNEQTLDKSFTIDSFLIANSNDNNNELNSTTATTKMDSKKLSNYGQPVVKIDAPPVTNCVLISPPKSFTVYNNNSTAAAPAQAAKTTSAPMKTKSAPWLNILTTPQVWVFIVTKISVRWCADVMTMELPTYLSNVLHLSIKLNGLLNSISAALFAIFSFISGCVANKLLKSRPGNLSKTTIRKIIQGFASFGGALGLFLMTSNDCNLIVTISMLMFLSCCLVFGTGGELQIPFDMTSEYPGTLHGLACSLSVSGWLAPPLVGLVLGDQPNSRARWSIVWYSTAFMSFIGGLVFVLFADARPIDFTINSNSCSSPAIDNDDNDLNRKEESKRQQDQVKLNTNQQKQQQQQQTTDNYSIIVHGISSKTANKANRSIDDTRASQSAVNGSDQLTFTNKSNKCILSNVENSFSLDASTTLIGKNNNDKNNKNDTNDTNDNATNNDNNCIKKRLLRYLLFSQYYNSKIDQMKINGQLMKCDKKFSDKQHNQLVLVEPVDMSTNNTWSDDYVTITHL